MDFLCTDERNGRNLLDSISRVMIENEIDIVVAVTTNRNSEFSLMRKTGFRQVPEFLLPQKLPFIIRVHERFEHSALLFDLVNWHFSFGDYDIF